MKRLCFLSSLLVCSLALAETNVSANITLAQPIAVPPAHVAIPYPRYTGELAIPLIEPQERVANERLYHNPGLADLVCRAHALDIYIFDGLRLVRTYGPVVKSHHRHDGHEVERLSHEYKITKQEARCWIEASKQFEGRYHDSVDAVEADLLPQANVLYDELLGRLPRHDVRSIMQGTSFYRHEPVEVPAQRQIVTPPPVIVQPAPVPAIGIGIGVGGGHRW